MKQENRLHIDRRRMMAGGAATMLAASLLPSLSIAAQVAKPLPAFMPPLGARVRLLLVNDLAGDVDGLFAAVHALLSPSLDLRGIVATGTPVRSESAANATAIAHDMLSVMGRENQVQVFTGAERKLPTPMTPDRSSGTMAIIQEAMRTDSALPLYIAAGGGLTEVASALMIAPEIAQKFTLIWIGGGAYPAGNASEYNFSIDRQAARYVFNDTLVPLWQVPDAAYAQCQVSINELQSRIANRGPIGTWLYEKMYETVRTYGERFKLNTGETWTMGDSPLVLLSALSAAQPTGMTPVKRYEGTGASRYETIFAPLLQTDGTYQPRTDGRRIRAYHSLDTRLMFEDFYAKLERAAA